MPRARLCRTTPSPLSMIRVRMPRASSSQASTRPVGPAPTISTWQSFVMTADWTRTTHRDIRKITEALRIFQHEPGFVGPGHQLRAVIEPELGQDVIDVRVDGANRQVKPVGDAPVGKTPRDQGCHLKFALGERPARTAAPGLFGLVRERIGDPFGRAHLRS